MGVGGGFRDQQDKQQVDRGAIDGIIIDGGIQMQQGADRRAATCQAAVGNGDAIAKTGGAQFFASPQAVEDVLHLQLGYLLGDQVGDLFQGALLTAARHVHEGTAGGQDGFKSDHG